MPVTTRSGRGGARSNNNKINKETTSSNGSSSSANNKGKKEDLLMADSSYKVKYYNIARGYGKAEGADGQEVFFHHKQRKAGSGYPREGQEIQAEALEDEGRGPYLVEWEGGDLTEVEVVRIRAQAAHKKKITELTSRLEVVEKGGCGSDKLLELEKKIEELQLQGKQLLDKTAATEKKQEETAQDLQVLKTTVDSHDELIHQLAGSAAKCSEILAQNQQVLAEVKKTNEKVDKLSRQVEEGKTSSDSTSRGRSDSTAEKDRPPAPTPPSRKKSRERSRSRSASKKRREKHLRRMSSTIGATKAGGSGSGNQQGATSNTGASFLGGS
ncbi:unnamed protein product [Amoebophrya sp. A25]|nr:unnamed protein product [Amoebophrya sp. A25]|eukprot:GSA25T00026126001.1